MNELKRNIDFGLIWRKIHDQLTDQEETLLKEWLADDASHRKYYDDVINYYNSGTQFSNSPAELKKALRNIYRIIGIYNPYRKPIIISITSVAASILFFVFLHFFSSNPTGAIDVGQSVQSIAPGTEKAVLILSDGSEHDLTSGEKTIKAANGIEIKNTGTKLEYSSKGDQAGELKYNTLRIPRGGEYFLVLSDSTKVWLNSETTLRFPVQFAANVRNVELTGEAYFEVTKNEKVPFIVSSGNQQVKVLGTQFNVSSYLENANIYTTLVEGRVEVTTSLNPNEKIVLTPSEQSCFTKGENQLTKRNVDVNKYVAWKSGRFVFENETLEDIMKTLSKWYDVQVVFNNESNKKLRFTGNLERYSNFNEILKKIEKTNEVKFAITNNQITIE
jgi:Fe2+-dicitrate sensor, membrane component